MCLYFLVLLCSVVTYFGFKFCANYQFNWKSVKLHGFWVYFNNFGANQRDSVDNNQTIKKKKRNGFEVGGSLYIPPNYFSLVCFFLLVAWDSTCVTWMGCTDSPAPTGWHNHAQHHRKDAHVPANPHVWRRYQEMSCYATRAEQGCRRAWTQQCLCLMCMFLTRLSEWDSMRVLGIVDSVAILTRWVANIDRRAFFLLLH